MRRPTKRTAEAYLLRTTGGTTGEAVRYRGPFASKAAAKAARTDELARYASRKRVAERSSRDRADALAWLGPEPVCVVLVATGFEEVTE